MRKLSLLLILFALLPVGRTWAQSSVASDEYAVYSAVISYMIEKRRTRPVNLVLISGETAINGIKAARPDWKLRPQGIYGVRKDTLDDFVAKNNQPQRLERLFDLNVEYKLVDHQEYRKWFANLSEKPADALGIIYFSRVGFNRDNTQALLYREIRDPSRQVDYLLLVKEKGVWKVAREEMWWIA